MIDPNREKIITLSQAAARLPRRRAGRKASVSTPYRWTTKGCRGVFLEFLQIGATRCTSVEALGRFYERLTAAVGGPSSTDNSRSDRERSIARAFEELTREGI